MYPSLFSQFEALHIEVQTPETVVLLLSSPEEDILIKVSEAIYLFAEKGTAGKSQTQTQTHTQKSCVLMFPVHCLPLLLGDENKVSLLGFGALEPLCRLIAHNNMLVRCNAVMALGIMAVNGASDNIRHQWRLAHWGIWWLTIHYVTIGWRTLQFPDNLPSIDSVEWFVDWLQNWEFCSFNRWSDWLTGWLLLSD